MENKGFCVRIDAMEGYRQKIVMMECIADYPQIVAVQHKGKKGENLHFHLVISTTVNLDAIRKRMKKIFDSGRGNGHMSIKAWDGHIHALSYLFHEDPNVELILRKGVTDADVETYRKTNELIQQQVVTAKQRASWTLEDDAYEEFKGDDTGLRMVDDHSIAQYIVLYALRSGKYIPNDFLLKSIVSRVKFRLLEGDVDAEEKFVRRYVENVFSR